MYEWYSSDIIPCDDLIWALYRGSRKLPVRLSAITGNFAGNSEDATKFVLGDSCDVKKTGPEAGQYFHVRPPIALYKWAIQHSEE